MNVAAMIMRTEQINSTPRCISLLMILSVGLILSILAPCPGRLVCQLIFSCWKETKRNITPQEIAQWFPPLVYVINQQLISGHNALNASIVEAIQLSENIRGFGITRTEGCINAAVQGGGGVRIFGFSVFALKKNAVFLFWCLTQFAGFLQFSLWFSVFVNNTGGFSDFSVQCILRFFWFWQRNCNLQSR